MGPYPVRNENHQLGHSCLNWIFTSIPIFGRKHDPWFWHMTHAGVAVRLWRLEQCCGKRKLRQSDVASKEASIERHEQRCMHHIAFVVIQTVGYMHPKVRKRKKEKTEEAWKDAKVQGEAWTSSILVSPIRRDPPFSPSELNPTQMPSLFPSLARAAASTAGPLTHRML